MKKTNYYIFIIDIFLPIATYTMVYFNKFGHLVPQGVYYILFIVFLAYWYTLSTYYNKYSLKAHYLTYIKSIISSSMLTLFLITSTVSITELIAVSRLFILQITLIPMVVEILIVFVFQKAFSSKYILEVSKRTDTKINLVSNYKFIWVTIGALMLFITYILMIKLKTGTFNLYPWSERILLILFASWLVTFVLTKKYSIIKTNNIYYQIMPYFKSGLIMILIAAAIYFFFRIETLSRFLLFGTILIYTVLETLSFIVYYIVKNYDDKPNVGELLTKNNLAWEIEDFDFAIESEQNKEINIQSIFNQISSLEDKNQIVDFLEKNLKDIKINFYSSSILSTITVENIEIIRNNSKILLINLHKLNDISRLNQYLITSHMKLIPGGILVGYILPIETTLNRLRNKMPKLLFTLFYPFHFMFSRILPKIPKINRIYFLITKGKNRTISKAEMYGRLNFCGFKIENEKIINDKLFFIAKKVKTISTVTNPSYHPIVKLKRIGLNGKIIYIYKFRTMYPYSEFLQEYMYNKYHLTSSGNKFKNDFRVTNWGKFLRQFWIDELPQIYNWLRGDLNLIGVRALSEQYFSLYPKEHRELRNLYKPGLIPPFYVDLPNSLEAKIISEREYINRKRIAPIKTDVKYGFIALKNIIFKGVRSN